jgi:hypothetical protein
MSTASAPTTASTPAAFSGLSGLSGFTAFAFAFAFAFAAFAFAFAAFATLAAVAAVAATVAALVMDEVVVGEVGVVSIQDEIENKCLSGRFEALDGLQQDGLERGLEIHGEREVPASVQLGPVLPRPDLHAVANL